MYITITKQEYDSLINELEYYKEYCKELEDDKKANFTIKNIEGFKFAVRRDSESEIKLNQLIDDLNIKVQIIKKERLTINQIKNYNFINLIKWWIKK